MSSDYLEGLPKAVIRRVKALKQLQAEAVALEVAYQVGCRWWVVGGGWWAVSGGWWVDIFL